MICPSKICKCEIPDDSLFCDQCGIRILKCEKCGAIGISKFCGKCGGHMVFQEASETVPEQRKPEQSTPVPPVPSVQPVPPVQPAGTVIIDVNPAIAPVLELHNNDGWSITPKHGNILGRTTGEFAAELGKYPVISSRHAQITLKDKNWYITDLNATNKSYLNNVQIQPDVPTKLNNNDVLVLANVTFVVVIK
ncbi:MAG: FHA domain-containing protein [Treponema sp.]|nr:FHA domain-containing protein [Treponema sp.]